MLTLYFSPGASSMAPHIALHEVGAPFDGKPISLARKETHTPEFLAVNPEGKVPTLVIDGHILTEVAGTLYYLARRFPEAKLYPVGDIEAEAQVISWMSFIASTIHPARRVGPARLHEVFAIAEHASTPPELVHRDITNSGHLGLFMGHRALHEHWPPLLAGVLEHSRL